MYIILALKKISFDIECISSSHTKKKIESLSAVIKLITFDFHNHNIPFIYKLFTIISTVFSCFDKFGISLLIFPLVCWTAAVGLSRRLPLLRYTVMFDLSCSRTSPPFQAPEGKIGQICLARSAPVSPSGGGYGYT